VINLKNAWSIIMMLLLINVMFTIFSAVGLYGSYTEGGALEEDVDDWSIKDGSESVSLTDTLGILGLTGFTGIGTLAVTGIGTLVSIAAGINPYLSIAYGIVMGLYINLFGKFFTFTNMITSEFPAFSGVLNILIVVFSVIFGLIIIRTLIDMTATTPGRD